MIDSYKNYKQNIHAYKTWVSCMLRSSPYFGWFDMSSYSSVVSVLSNYVTLAIYMHRRLAYLVCCGPVRPLVGLTWARTRQSSVPCLTTVPLRISEPKVSITIDLSILITSFGLTTVLLSFHKNWIRSQDLNEWMNERFICIWIMSTMFSISFWTESMTASPILHINHLHWRHSKVECTILVEVFSVASYLLIRQHPKHWEDLAYWRAPKYMPSSILHCSIVDRVLPWRHGYALDHSNLRQRWVHELHPNNDAIELSAMYGIESEVKSDRRQNKSWEQAMVRYHTSTSFCISS